jgi:hypothetical protein
MTEQASQSEDTATIQVDHIKDGHVIVGYVACIKVLDEDGELYWATRQDGVNDAEAYGMGQIMVDNFATDLSSRRCDPDD